MKLTFTSPGFLITDLRSGLQALIQKKMPITNFVNGEKALHSPADGKKHKERLDDHEQVKNFFKLKSATDITKETNKTSEHVTIITPVNSVLDAGSTSSNASHAKLLDTCFQH